LALCSIDAADEIPVAKEIAATANSPAGSTRQFVKSFWPQRSQRKTAPGKSGGLPLGRLTIFSLAIIAPP